jgi:hypothetical protein
MKFLLVAFFVMLISIFCSGKKTRDAFKIIEAESADSAYMVAVYLDQLGDVDHGDWAVFENVQFDSVATGFKINLARPEPPVNSYRIEIYVDSMISKNLAGFHIVKDTKANSGCSGEECWQSFQTQYTKLTNPISVGKHKLFVKFVGGSGVANVNWFSFTTEESPQVSEYITLPDNGRVYHTNAYVAITASGTLDKEIINKVEFYKDDSLLATDRTLPFSCYTKIEQPGNYQLSIKAYENDSLLAAADQVEISVIERIENINAVSRIEAESFSDHKGVGDKGCGPYPLTINFLDGGDWAKYHSIDFGEKVNYIKLMHATDFDKPGTIEFYIDNLDSEPVGSWLALRTGNWHYYTSKTILLDTIISGVHDFFMKFQGGFGIGGIDFFNFGYDAKLTAESLINNDPTDGISIYPNPVINNCVVDFSKTKNQEASILIYNSTGKAVVCAERGRETQQVQVDLNDLPNGIYLAKINMNKGIAYRKIAVKH